MCVVSTNQRIMQLLFDDVAVFRDVTMPEYHCHFHVVSNWDRRYAEDGNKAVVARENMLLIELRFRDSTFFQGTMCLNFR